MSEIFITYRQSALQKAVLFFKLNRDRAVICYIVGAVARSKVVKAPLHALAVKSEKLYVPLSFSKQNTSIK